MPQDAPQAENELFQARLDKLARLRERGVDPYPRNYPRTHTTRQALALFADAEAQAAEGEEACSFIQIQLASQQRQDKGLEAEAT